MLAVVLVIMGALFSGRPAVAHTLGQSYLYLSVYDDRVTGRFEITLKDLNKALDLISADDQINEANINDHIGAAHDYYSKKVQFFSGQKLLPIRFSAVDLRRLKIGTYVLLTFIIIENAATPETIDIDYNVLFDKDPDHAGLLVIEHFWNANIFNNEGQVSLVFNPEDHRQQLSFTGYSMWHGFIGVVKLGIKHIWKGIDHILFLIALILPAAMLRSEHGWQPVTGFKPAFYYVLKIVTLFTIAHSITLSIAAVGLITLPSRLVESVIAISIAMAALDILMPIFKRKIGWVVFIFGLFHGFGFASVLTELGVLGEHMALSLFGFNLGVEIGQIVVIGLIFPALFFIRHTAVYPKLIMPYGAAAMILLAGIWFVERAFLEFSFARLVKNAISTLIG